MTPLRINVIGSLNTDFVTVAARIPLGGETLSASSFFTGLGGKGGNQAVACARLSRTSSSMGIQTTDNQEFIIKMIGAVGADQFGPQIISSLISSGVDVTGIKTNKDKTTGAAIIIVEEDSGENRILLNPGANHTILAADFSLVSSLGDPLPHLIILQLEIPLPTVLQILKTAKMAGVEVLLNPTPAVFLPTEAYQGLAHLILNESEAATLTGRSLSNVNKLDFNWSDVTKEFIAKGVQNVTVTLGARGAIFGSCKKDHTKAEYIPAAKVKKVVDTTAAGDTFIGAYALGVLKGEEIMNVLRYACLAAARTIEKKGAQDSIPWSNEVEL